MDVNTFWKLCKLMELYLDDKKHNSYFNATPNGMISNPIKISIVLQYFAGGSPLDIALVHGVSYPE
jgi:hypothetical protein